MESFTILMMMRLATAVEVVTGLIIAFAAAAAAVRTARLWFVGLKTMAVDGDAVRLRLGKWLSLALEFALAADIVRTAVAPGWEDIGKLASVMALRTTLNYFLEREFDQAERVSRDRVRVAA